MAASHLITYDLRTGNTEDMGEMRLADGRPVVGTNAADTGPDGTIYCLYERGSTDGKNIYKTDRLTVARFNLEWLTDGKDSPEKP